MKTAYFALPLIVLLLIALPLTALAEDAVGDVISPRIGFLEAGVVCSPAATGTIPAPDTIAGVTNLIDEAPPFVSTGRLVPGVLGVGFGVKSAPAGGGEIPVTMTVTHPPMGPEGVTHQSYPTTITDNPSISLYDFEFAYEIVPGDWSFAATTGKDVLFTVHFTVVDPREVPDLAGVCGYEDLLS
ncbi:MAG: DUF3859 domain-containing protein [Rubellimicrobium sp.]|nr:DUF3859 domain-containing protein [Rubellimicrobium sp.]